MVPSHGRRTHTRFVIIVGVHECGRPCPKGEKDLLFVLSLFFMISFFFSFWFSCCCCCCCCRRGPSSISLDRLQLFAVCLLHFLSFRPLAFGRKRTCVVEVSGRPCCVGFFRFFLFFFFLKQNKTTVGL